MRPEEITIRRPCGRTVTFGKNHNLFEIVDHVQVFLLGRPVADLRVQYTTDKPGESPYGDWDLVRLLVWREPLPCPARVEVHELQDGSLSSWSGVDVPHSAPSPAPVDQMALLNPRRLGEKLPRKVVI